jgi:alpha-1,3-rhamnosyl/mannosyltransferase
MRIGFDVSCLHGYGGVNRYSMEIIGNLVRHHPQHTAVLLSSFSRAKTERIRQSFCGPSIVTRPVLPNPLALGSGLRRLVSALRGAILDHCSKDLDVLHLTRPFADRVRSGNIVLTVHDLFPLILDEYRGEEAEREFRMNAGYMLEKAAGIITPSSCVARRLQEMFPAAAGKVWTVPHAASREFRPVPSIPESLHSLGIKENGYYLYVGSAYPRKNLPALIRAYEALPEEIRRDRSLVMVLTGVGRHIDGLLSSFPDLGSRPGTVILRGIPGDQLVRLYSCSTALVFPSLEEGFGLPILEAMQCGCPVITSDRSCLPEVAGGAALLVDPSSSESIRDAMEQLAVQPGLRSELSSAGLGRARDFSWEGTVESNLKVYSGVLG